MDVDVYKNLNDECLSIRSREPESYGRVVDHREQCVVDDVEFVVQPAGRDRVREEQRKNVHAFVRGTIIDDQSWEPDNATAVTYDPYRFDSFVTAGSHVPVSSAERVLVRPDGVRAIGIDAINQSR